IGTYPAAGAAHVYQDAVVKAFFSKPVRGVDARTFTLADSTGAQVPAWVDQIGDGVYGLFANQVLLKVGETYTARLAAGLCALAGNGTRSDRTWSFQVAADPEQGAGDTTIPSGFSARYQTWASAEGASTETQVAIRAQPPARRRVPAAAPSMG